VARFTGINQPPSADAGGPYTITEGDGVFLDGSQSNDPDDVADLLSYSWDLNNDGTPDATGKTPFVSWSTLHGLGINDNGTYSISLKVSDGSGASTTDTTNLVVLNQDPTLALAGAATVNEGSIYTLTLGAVVDAGNDTVTRTVIDWGDGETSTFDAT